MACNMNDGSGLYSGWRKDCGPTIYPSNKTAVTSDVLEAGLLFAGAIIGISFIIIIPGFQGKERAFFFLRNLIGLFILTSIMLCNFGQEWEVAHLRTKTFYRAGIGEEIEADIGVKIGLRSVNITLKAIPETYEFKNGTHKETINYNERFHWNNLGWTLGRLGFGKYAGRFNQEFREAQFEGKPLPILWIAEYFTLDGEGIRWGRHYLQAGFYTHIMMWAAFPLWILTMSLTGMVMHYSGFMAIITGLSLLVGNMLFASVRNRNELDMAIPFEDGRLHFTWGWCFWLNLVTGCLCLILGILVVILVQVEGEMLASFLGVDILQEYGEEVYADPHEVQELLEKKRRSRSLFKKRNTKTQIPLVSIVSSQPVESPSTSEDGIVYEDVNTASSPGPTTVPTLQRQFRRRLDTGFGKSKKTLPRPNPKRRVQNIEENGESRPIGQSNVGRSQGGNSSPPHSRPPPAKPSPKGPPPPSKALKPKGPKPPPPKTAQKPSPKGGHTPQRGGGPPQVPMRDDSGRSTAGDPSAILSGKYDNNDTPPIHHRNVKLKM